ncbi:DUF6515 family protein [Shewanella salipaludis]|uniref:Uncharacterized protein n=1 Tax=Shewanella salipaludis TaxID=2723052 RepID=A0A972G3W0_9GAMM|nr:DUF6515 family protein [Shewanella salipaludis]NMH67006.1 hypothetical protein [Shewanella salipaludis]
MKQSIQWLSAIAIATSFIYSGYALADPPPHAQAHGRGHKQEQHGHDRHEHHRHYDDRHHDDRHHDDRRYRDGRHYPASLPTDSVYIRFGQQHFGFSGGLFYRNSNFGFELVHPPIGLRLGYLPSGYHKFHRHNRDYYVLNQTYYIYHDDSREYEVVDAPVAENITHGDDYQIGGLYRALPRHSRPVTRNGMQYFRFRHWYFLPQSHGNEVKYLALQFH